MLNYFDFRWKQTSIRIIRVKKRIFFRALFTGKKLIRSIFNSIFIINIVLRINSSWVFKLLRQSRKRTINLNDLYPVLPEFEAKMLTDKLENNWNSDRERNPRNPSLIRATLSTMGWTPFLAGLLLIPKVIFPIFLSMTVSIENVWLLISITGYCHYLTGHFNYYTVGFFRSVSNLFYILCLRYRWCHCILFICDESVLSPSNWLMLHISFSCYCWKYDTIHISSITIQCKCTV